VHPSASSDAPPPASGHEGKTPPAQVPRSHAVAASRVAGHLGLPRLTPEATTAALLHDVEKLALTMGNPFGCADIVRIARESARPLHEFEREALGCDHADAGAALLDLWGLDATRSDPA